jgi:thiol-disulfide isomerase/thioredoxin
MIDRILLSLLCIALAGCGQQWTDQRGGQVQETDLQGRWMVVNYWAEWCAPCREELPELNALAEVSDEVIVLGIHFDAYEGEELRALSDQMGIRFAVVGHDFAEAYGLNLPQVLPTTYIINPQGKVAHSLQGPQTERDLLALLPIEGADND